MALVVEGRMAQVQRCTRQKTRQSQAQSGRYRLRPAAEPADAGVVRERVDDQDKQQDGGHERGRSRARARLGWRRPALRELRQKRRREQQVADGAELEVDGRGCSRQWSREQTPNASALRIRTKNRTLATRA